MRVVKNIKIIIPVIASILAILLLSSLYTRPKTYKEVLGHKNACDLTSGHYLAMKRCLRNSLISIFDNSRLGFEIVDELCERGLGLSCYVKDSYSYLHTAIGYSRIAGNLQADIRNCLVNPVTLDYENYYCDRLLIISKTVNDRATPRTIEILKCNGNENCLLPSNHDAYLSPTMREGLFNKLCSDFKQTNEFCNNLSLLVRIDKYIANPINQAGEGNPINELCEKSKEVCEIVLNSPQLIEKVIIEPQKFSKISYKGINQFSAIEISTLVPDALTVPTELIEFLPFKNLLLAKLSRYQDIESDCLKEIIDGCVLQFQNLEILKTSESKASELCKKGDRIACLLIQILKSGIVSKEDGTSKLLSILGSKDMMVVKHIKNHPTVKIRTWINTYKYYLMAFFLIIIATLQVYVFILFKRNKDVFTFIRNNQLKELKDKINRLK